jgi:flagellar basal body-associated protein FliL
VIWAIVGSLLFLLLVAGLLIFFLFYRKSEESEKESTSVSELTPPLPDSEVGNIGIDDHEFVNILSVDTGDGIESAE